MQYEGIRIFPSEKEAWTYIYGNNKQCIQENGRIIELDAIYDKPVPVLHREMDAAGRREGIAFNFGDNAFLSDESERYDLFILEDDCWIIQEHDGRARVWSVDSGEPFFRDEYICENVCGKGRCDSV